MLSEGATQGLNDTATTAETKYSVSSSRSGKKNFLSLYIIKATVFYLLMPQNISTQSKKNLK